MKSAEVLQGGGSQYCACWWERSNSEREINVSGGKSAGFFMEVQRAHLESNLSPDMPSLEIFVL